MKEKIALYPALSDEERRGVEQYVEQHPHLREELEDAKALADLLQEARLLEEDPPSDAALAYYAVMRRVQADKMPAPVADAFERIERRLAEDPERRRRLDDMERRRAELESRSDAAERFERLTRLRPAVPPRTRRRDPRHVRFLWRTAAAVVAIAALYSVLYEVGMRLRPDYERMARFRAAELTVEGFETVRTAEPDALDPSSATAFYLHALEQLRRAESSFIGLFPRFDLARLDSAESLLRRVVELEPEGSFLDSEAKFLLGKTHLARGERTRAGDAFRDVTEAGGRRAEEAARMLAWTQR